MKASLQDCIAVSTSVMNKFSGRLICTVSRLESRTDLPAIINANPSVLRTNRSYLTSKTSSNRPLLRKLHHPAKLARVILHNFPLCPSTQLVLFPHLETYRFDLHYSSLFPHIDTTPGAKTPNPTNLYHKFRVTTSLESPNSVSATTNPAG